MLPSFYPITRVLPPFPLGPAQAISYTAALEASETKTEQWVTTLQLLQEVIEGGMVLDGWHFPSFSIMLHNFP